jgi:hypothetical protein
MTAGHWFKNIHMSNQFYAVNVDEQEPNIYGMRMAFR